MSPQQYPDSDLKPKFHPSWKKHSKLKKLRQDVKRIALQKSLNKGLKKQFTMQMNKISDSILPDKFALNSERSDHVKEYD